MLPGTCAAEAVVAEGAAGRPPRDGGSAGGAANDGVQDLALALKNPLAAASVKSAAAETSCVRASRACSKIFKMNRIESRFMLLVFQFAYAETTLTVAGRWRGGAGGGLGGGTGGGGGGGGPRGSGGRIPLPTAL
jgi:hypothetical protein